VKPPRQEVDGVASPTWNDEAPDWNDDEQLMLDIAAALHQPAADPKILAAARGAFAWRTVDEDLGLLRMFYDSYLETEATVRDTGTAQGRLLAFQTEGFGVEIELRDASIEGQLIPPQPGEITLVTVEGTEASATADEVGCFTLPAPPHGPMRLQCATDTGRLTTEWVTV
jgi:hypothetical protein